jgi:thioesterase domain-containing protein
LVGHSFGGWIAFEMALLLSKTTYPVSSLTMIDSQAPDENGLQIREYTSAEAMARLASLFNINDLSDFRLDQLELLDDTSRLKLFHSSLVRANLLPHRSDFKALEGMVRTFEAAIRTSYQPNSALLCPSHLVLAQDSDHFAMNNELRLEINANRWRRWLPNLIVWKAPGNHMTMLKSPHVQVLGKRMQGYLSDSFLLEEVRD